MNSVVVMPTAKRPEMLALALERLSRAVDAPTDVRIFLDVSQDEKIKKIRIEETEYVRDTFFPTASITHVRPHFLVPSGMYNILFSLKSGWETGAISCFPFGRGYSYTPKRVLFVALSGPSFWRLLGDMRTQITSSCRAMISIRIPARALSMRNSG